jgi:short-subunit dehydrogenase
MERLDRDVVVITGASRGLGRALAIGLARAGARTVLVARDAEALAETARRAGAAGPEPLAIAADIGQPAAVQALREQVLAAAPPTVLINNAGQFLAGSLAETSPGSVAGLLNAVVVGSMLMTQAFLPSLRAASGHVINIGARVASPAVPLDVSGTSIPYQTAKRHLTVFAAALRQEAPEVSVATLYLPPIGSMADLDDSPAAVRQLYGGASVLSLHDVVEVVTARLAGTSPRWEEWVLSPG